MSTPQTSEPPRAPISGWRRFLWDGVLPEALGVCFVTIIVAGFAASYLIAEHAWQRKVASAEQTVTDTIAQALASAANVAADEEAAIKLLEHLAKRAPGVRTLTFTPQSGTPRVVWSDKSGELNAATPNSSADAFPRGALFSTCSLRMPDGRPLGTLRVARALPPSATQDSLVWPWGGGAAVTLTVFVLLYSALRRHLRPVAAIERNLNSLASGIEKELATLALSDSLGGAAQAWNRLIGQFSEMQRQLQHARESGAGPNVLARLENAAFRRVVDQLPFGVLWVGENDTITYANASAGALLARTPEQLVGQSIGPAMDNPAVVQAVTAVRSRGGTGLSVDHTRKDGEQESTLRFRVVPLAEASVGADALVTVEDISQLRETQRARDAFLYHVTHELRTPLTNIHAYAETLTQPDFDDEQTRKECYNVLISETERLARLVENILSISQLEVGTARLDMGEVDLARLMRQMVQDNLGAADEKHIDLTLALPPKMPKIRGDKQRLCVLVNNLIGNALKYTRANGKVHVSVTTEAGTLQIAVADTGIGISPDDQAHVFEKFYRAASDDVQAITGTGLGLALAREVARLHGGEIHLQSELGKGSVFTVELPLPAGTTAEVAAR